MNPRTTCDACRVEESALCHVLSDDGRARTCRLATHRRVGAGRTMMFSADACGGVATVVSGVVKIIRSLDDGRQQIVALQFPGDLVGTRSVDGDIEVAIAATDVELCCIDRANLDALTQSYPELIRELLERARADLHVARDWMLLLGRKSAEERVASFILALAKRAAGAEPDGRAVIGLHLPLSRADIADFLGLTIETVSRQLHRLKDAGVLQIERQRSITVLDRQRLAREAEHLEA